MLHYQELIFIMNKKYPDLIQGKDFVASHLLNPEGEQIKSADIMNWKNHYTEPTEEDIKEWEDEFRDKYENEYILIEKKTEFGINIRNWFRHCFNDITYNEVKYKADQKRETNLFNKIAYYKLYNTVPDKVSIINSKGEKVEFIYKDFLELCETIHKRNEQIRDLFNTYSAKIENAESLDEFSTFENELFSSNSISRSEFNNNYNPEIL